MSIGNVVDKRMSNEMNRRAIIPLCLNLGARHLVRPYLGAYKDEEKSLKWGLGHKDGGDKRHRTDVGYVGIHYADGDKREGATHEIVVDRRIEWSVRHDNRLLQNKQEKELNSMSFVETFNKLRTFSSFDLIQRFSASAKGEVLGIGGSSKFVYRRTRPYEIETEKFNRTKEERVLKDKFEILCPGPILYDADVVDDDGTVLHRKGTIAEEGKIWLVECPVATVHTVTPHYAVGNVGRPYRAEPLRLGWQLRPHAERPHDSVLEFSGVNELISFMQGDLVLQYQWLPASS